MRQSGWTSAERTATNSFRVSTAGPAGGPLQGRTATGLILVARVTDIYGVHASVAETHKGDGGSAEVQTVSSTGVVPTGGTYTLSFNGYTTGAIAQAANAATIQTALRALTSIGGANVTVTGGALGSADIVVTFAGTLATGDQPAITIDTSLLTSGNTPSITFSFNGVDDSLGVTWTLLAAAAAVAAGSKTLTVGPGVAASANVSAGLVLPDMVEVTATHGDTDPVTYTGAVYLVY